MCELKMFKANKLYLVIASVSLLLGACSSSYDTAQTPGMSDPFEGTNRKVFAFNQQFDKFILNPALDGYRAVVPSPARTGVDNAINNIQKPASVINSLLQGDVSNAWDNSFDFIVNTLVGFGGLLDLTGHEGYTSRKEDFGQTLAAWGLIDGPYLVAPFLGGTSLRDGVGYGVDSFFDPIRWYSQNIDESYIRYNKMGATYLNMRNNLKDILVELENSSIDYYASVRSTYYQHRQKEIHNGETSQDAMEFPEYDDY